MAEDRAALLAEAYRRGLLSPEQRTAYEEAVRRGLVAAAEPAAPAAPQRQGSMLGNLVDSFTRGATLGFGDEITAAEAALLGRTPEGGFFDYSRPIGERYARALEAERAQNAAFQEANPALSTGAEIGGAIGAALATGGGAAAGPVMRGAQAITAPVARVSQLGAPVPGASMLSNAVRGAAGGATVGGIYGFGTGEGGVGERVENMGAPLAFGAAAGAVAPAAVAGVNSLARRLLDRPSTEAANQAIARATGGSGPRVSAPAVRMVRDAVSADAAFGGGAPRIAEGGRGAMLADAGDTTANLLDGVASFPGARTVVAQRVQERAAEAGEDLVGALDRTLGRPQGVQALARDIAQSTQPARRATYEAAYAKPIDYAADAGRRIEDVVSRIPRDILRRAVQEANDEMQSLGIRNQQILADIADDGTVTFREMPNVQQLDQIKQALQRIGYSVEVDAFGRPTGAGLRARRLAGELREALGEAVPEYNAATQAGADKIGMDSALELGARLLRPQTTREEVADAVRRMSPAEKMSLGEGLRSQIDETMANVTRAVTDGNMDAREAQRILRDLSSRAAREKVTAAIGDVRATQLFGQIEETARALELRAATATNSRTAPRSEVAANIRAERDTVANQALAGNVNVVPRLVQTVTGRTPADMARMDAGIATDIAQLLTAARGGNATALAQLLMMQERAIPGVAQPVGSLAAMLAGATRPGAAAGADIASRQP